MPKAKIENDFDKEEIKEIEEIEEENISEKSYEVVESKPVKEEPVLEKKPFRVSGIRGDKIVLIDSKGNGFRIPLPKEYENVKPGDIIYL